MTSVSIESWVGGHRAPAMRGWTAGDRGENPLLGLIAPDLPDGQDVVLSGRTTSSSSCIRSRSDHSYAT